MYKPDIRPFQTPEDYRSAPPLRFPWESAHHSFVIEEAAFSCGCGEPLVDVRGYIVDLEAGIELDVAGVCLKCFLIVPISMKIFPERNIALHHKGGDHWAVLRFDRTPQDATDDTPAMRMM